MVEVAHNREDNRFENGDGYALENASAEKQDVRGGTTPPDCSAQGARQREQEGEAFAILIRDGRDKYSRRASSVKKISREKGDFRERYVEEQG